MLTFQIPRSPLFSEQWLKGLVSEELSERYLLIWLMYLFMTKYILITACVLDLENVVRLFSVSFYWLWKMYSQYMFKFWLEKKRGKIRKVFHCTVVYSEILYQILNNHFCKSYMKWKLIVIMMSFSYCYILKCPWLSTEKLWFDYFSVKYLT